jgi:hypothetical protein
MFRKRILWIATIAVRQASWQPDFDTTGFEQVVQEKMTPLISALDSHERLTDACFLIQFVA